MRVTVQKWGTSLALRIPKAFASQTKIRENKFVDLTLEGGRIFIEPSKDKLTLKDLVDKIDESNLHGEFDFGEPVGNEKW